MKRRKKIELPIPTDIDGRMILGPSLAAWMVGIKREDYPRFWTAIRDYPYTADFYTLMDWADEWTRKNYEY